MQARTTQTDPAYFSPNAGDWDPSRWLKSGSSSVEINNGTPEQREMMLVWGKGSRACLGQHMAVMEIMVTVARLLAAYSLRIASDKTHDDMIMTDHFTLIPKGQRCGLTFEKAS